MGACQSHLESESKRSALIDCELFADGDAKRNSILLLGPGESGKSTFMKQLIHLFGTGHDPEQFRPIIYRNVMRNISHLVLKSELFARDSPIFAMDGSLIVQAENIKFLAERVEGMELASVREVMDPTVARIISKIWSDEGIQATYEQRSRLQLLDSSKYFLDRVNEIGAPGYLPSTQDIILSRVRTTGFQEAKFTFGAHKFSVMDVGGQRSERKKWMSFFSQCRAVVFFTALSEYDMTLYEDEETNRMDEALLLFEEICNSRWFSQTCFILFLNKKDLFADKLKISPLNEYFKDFRGESTFIEGATYFKRLFESKNKQERKVFTHFTCVVDDSVEKLFADVAQIVMKEQRYSTSTSHNLA